jgi:hypothetical protein
MTKDDFSKDSKKRQAFTNGVAEVLSVASAQVLIEDVSGRRSSGLRLAERRQAEVCRLCVCLCVCVCVLAWCAYMCM